MKRALVPCHHRIQIALAILKRYLSLLDWEGSPEVLTSSPSTDKRQQRVRPENPSDTYTQHCFLVFGPPNFGLSRQLIHSPQSCNFRQPLHFPQRVIRFFLPWWWETWRRTGGGAALTANSAFTCFCWPFSLSEAEEVSAVGKSQKGDLPAPTNTLLLTLYASLLFHKILLQTWQRLIQPTWN